jgi:hypothetical protein
MLKTSAVAGPALTIFPPQRDQQRTICVLGAPRGGTSMVAGILRRLGVFMGSRIDESSNEDLAFLAHDGMRELFQQPERADDKARYLKDVIATIHDRSTNNDVWGWKDPISAFYLQDLLPHLTNPCFIVVTRDPAAIVQRERLEEGLTGHRNLLAYLRLISEVYANIAKLVDQRSRPTLLISYERALRAPHEAGRAIAGFVGFDAPADFDDWVADYVTPDRMNATIEALPRQHPAVARFAGNSAAEILIEESVRVRSEGVIASHVLEFGNITATANKLFQSAAAALNSQDYAAAQNSALAIIHLHSPQFTSLKDGALGAIAEHMFGGGEEMCYPDVVAGAYYLMGISSLLMKSGQRALVNLSVAELMMRRRLDRQLPGSILSGSNYWSSVFHKGMAARALRRLDLVAQVQTALNDAASDTPPAWARNLGRTGLEDAVRRAAALSRKPVRTANGSARTGPPSGLQDTCVSRLAIFCNITTPFDPLMLPT